MKLVDDMLHNTNHITDKAVISLGAGTTVWGLVAEGIPIVVGLLTIILLSIRIRVALKELKDEDS